MKKFQESHIMRSSSPGDRITGPKPPGNRGLFYSDGYGEFALGRKGFLKLPLEIRQVRCSQCSACTIRCPNGVEVTQRLMRAQELFA